MTAYIKGQPQEVQYGLTGRRVFIQPVADDGSAIYPTSAPTYEIKNNAGSSIATGTCTALPVAEYQGSGFFYCGSPAGETYAVPYVGSVAEGQTTGATANVVRVIQTGAESCIVVVDSVSGAFDGSEQIIFQTSNGDPEGLVDMTSAVLSGVFYCEPATTATATYPIGENYSVTFSFSYSALGATLARKVTTYFDVVSSPFDPVVTSDDINALHPDWSQMHPDGVNATWDVAIGAAHAELATRIRALGNRANLFVRREELYPIEMAMVEAQIAKRTTQMMPEIRDFWIRQAEDRWNARGEFAYAEDADEDGQVDEVETLVTGSRFTT